MALINDAPPEPIAGCLAANHFTADLSSILGVFGGCELDIRETHRDFIRLFGSLGTSQFVEKQVPRARNLQRSGPHRE